MAVLSGWMKNPVVMTAHVWHTTTQQDGINTQNHCRAGEIHNGYLLILVEQAGVYYFDLRRWPKELDQPIRAGIAGRTHVLYVSDFEAGVALDIHTAKLEIMTHHKPQQIYRDKLAVEGDERVVIFEVSLETGLYRVQSAFMDQLGNERGAYYLEARWRC
ncbi:MAG: hypothetical protein AAF571_04775 [Verrucomicrobiota bacterium]